MEEKAWYCSRVFPMPCDSCRERLFSRSFRALERASYWLAILSMGILKSSWFHLACSWTREETLFLISWILPCVSVYWEESLSYTSNREESISFCLDKFSNCLMDMDCMALYCSMVLPAPLASCSAMLFSRSVLAFERELE